MVRFICRLGIVLILLSITTLVNSQELIFEDGFESGDTSAWSIEIVLEIREYKIGTEVTLRISAEGTEGTPNGYKWIIVKPNNIIFRDGFESGDTSAWSRRNIDLPDISFTIDQIGIWLIEYEVSWLHEKSPGVPYSVEQTIIIRGVNETSK